MEAEALRELSSITPAVNDKEFLHRCKADHFVTVLSLVVKEVG
jgi:hypothetical protein